MLVDAPKKPLGTLLLAHGAGAPMDSPFMAAFATGLAAQHVRVVRFEFAYMDLRRREGTRRPPDRMPALTTRFREVAATLPKRAPLVIGGKSMGSRVAVQLADELAEERDLRGVVALGYPFHPPGRPDKLRTDALKTLRTPCLIVQGTRDALGDRDEVSGYGLPGSVMVHWIEDGDHSLAPRRASGRTTAQNLAEAIDRVATFVREAVS